MFKILDGREHFYQWDTDCQLIIDSKDIKEVHFCNRTDECSLVCETYTKDDLLLVDVPNILLQDDWRIKVYAYDGNRTRYDACFEVTKRSKPSDYIYTETEILDWKNHTHPEATYEGVNVSLVGITEVLGGSDYTIKDAELYGSSTTFFINYQGYAELEMVIVDNPATVQFKVDGISCFNPTTGIASYTGNINEGITIYLSAGEVYVNKFYTSYSYTSGFINGKYLEKVDDLQTSMNEVYEVLDLKAHVVHTHDLASYWNKDLTITQDMLETNETTVVADVYNNEISLVGYCKVRYSGEAEVVINITDTMGYQLRISIDGNEIYNGVPQLNDVITYKGVINDGIVINGSMVTLHFTKFATGEIVGNDGFMSGEQVKAIEELEASMGDISAALDNIIAIQEELIGGAE